MPSAQGTTAKRFTSPRFIGDSDARKKELSATGSDLSVARFCVQFRFSIF